ncbi:MAG: cyclic pyranopterin monophosphate synthase MoaC [Pseudomonadota bacterium]
MSELTHLDEEGRVRMVDVSEKPATPREAIAKGTVTMRPETLELIKGNKAKKGNVIETARIAGIMAVKKTSELIPMCHPLLITHVSVDFSLDEPSSSIGILATVKATGQTGVEMEALTAVSVAALTIYDMCKSYDREIIISNVKLIKKSGGKSGTFVRGNE